MTYAPNNAAEPVYEPVEIDEHSTALPPSDRLPDSRPRIQSFAASRTQPISTQMVEQVRGWFQDYAHQRIHGGGLSEVEAKRRAAHAQQVRREAISLSADLGLPPSASRLAGLLGLLHDMGGFEQDPPAHLLDPARSRESAELGLALLEQDGVLEPLPGWARDITRQAILDHLQHSVARHRGKGIRNEADPAWNYTRLLHDADRLDHWRMALQEYQRVNGHRNPIVREHLSETPGYSLAVRESVLAGHPVDPRQVRNLNDLRLLQLGWVFDLQFEPTRRRVRARHIVNRLRLTLHGCGDTSELFRAVNAHLDPRSSRS